VCVYACVRVYTYIDIYIYHTHTHTQTHTFSLLLSCHAFASSTTSIRKRNSQNYLGAYVEWVCVHVCVYTTIFMYTHIDVSLSPPLTSHIVPKKIKMSTLSQVCHAHTHTLVPQSGPLTYLLLTSSMSHIMSRI